jgi:hypothetical protein
LVTDTPNGALPAGSGLDRITNLSRGNIGRIVTRLGVDNDRINALWRSRGYSRGGTGYLHTQAGANALGSGVVRTGQIIGDNEYWSCHHAMSLLRLCGRPLPGSISP